MEHNKLVRHRIPELLAASGVDPFTHVAAEEEYRARLTEKLSEEVGEFRASGELEELADVLEVVYAIAQLRGVGSEQLERIRGQKAETRGAFAKRIVLERTEP